jgi:hypothetical protein
MHAGIARLINRARIETLSIWSWVGGIRKGIARLINRARIETVR